MLTLRRGRGCFVPEGRRLCIFFTFLSWSVAWTHPDLEIQVAGLSRRIEEEPENATLFFRRGELHRVHRDWLAALADYRRASELDPGLHIVHFCLGKMLLEADFPSLSLPALDRFVAVRPDGSEAALVRARALLRLGLRLDAVEEFTRGIELQLRFSGSRRMPRPEDYADRARALAAEGDEHVGEAIRGLDEGVKSLGGAVALELLAIDLELTRGRSDAALDRLAAIAARSPRREGWLARRGEILAEAGRPAEARRAFEEALKAIEALPAHRRGTPAMAELAARVRHVLCGLAPEGSSETQIAQETK